MYKCPHCGGEMDFLPGTEIVKCEYCDSEFKADEVINFNKKLVAKEYTEKVDNDDQAAEEGKAAKKGKASKKDDKTIEATIFTCPQCGGEIYSMDQSAVTFCSYCGSQVELKSRLERIRKPDYVLPFKITADQGKEAYLKKVRGAIFAPSYLKKDTEVEKLRGIYMPYWTYSVKAPHEISISTKTTRMSGSYQYTDHYSTKITTEGNIEGISFDAASAFADELSEALAPYDIAEAKPYNPAYLSSFYADESDVNSNLYEDEAILTAADAYADTVYVKDMDAYGITKSAIAKGFTADGVESTLAYYPVWFLANRNKKGNGVSYGTVNGQTGKAVVDLPVDFKKYLLGSLIIAIPIFLLLTLALTLTPRILILITMILSMVVVVMANFKLNAVYTRKFMFDDLGLSSVTPGSLKRADAIIRKKRKDSTKVKDKQSIGSVVLSTLFMAPFVMVVFGYFDHIGIGFCVWVAILIFRIIYTAVNNKNPGANKKATIAAPMKEKFGTLWKCLASFVIGGVVLIVYPVNDIYYYAVAVVAIILVAWTVLDLIRGHNVLTTRKLPQFGKRGGDEHEY